MKIFFCRPVAAAACALIVTLCSTQVCAKEMRLNDSEVKKRLAFLSQSLKEQQSPAALWFGGWLALQSLGIIFSTATAIADPGEGKWQSKTVTGVQSGIGIAGLLIVPMGTAYGYSRINSLPETSIEERYLKFQEAEALLESAAKMQKGGTSWIAHAAGAALGISGGLLIWLVFERPWWEGALNLLTMVAGAEARIFTQPQTAIDEWQRYQRKFIHGISTNADAQHRSNTSVTLVVLPGLIYASLRF